MFVDASYKDANHYIISTISFGEAEANGGAKDKIEAALKAAQEIGLISSFEFENIPHLSIKRYADTSPLHTGRFNITWPSTPQLEVPEKQHIADAVLLNLLAEQDVQLSPNVGILSGNTGRLISRLISQGDLGLKALEAEIITRMPTTAL